MGRIKKDYSLYSRELQDGRVCWYYRTYDEDGRRTAGISTGKTSKTAAENECNRLMRQGKLIPVKAPTLRAWAESECWWVWGECKYLHKRLRRDREKLAVSQRYADDALRDLRTYILPAHGEMRLDRITTGDCEDLLLAWEKQGLSDKSISNKASVYRIMMGEAERLGKIARNPWARIESFKPNSRKKGILSMEEARTLLDPKTIDTVWAGNRLTWCASLFASVTACRLGEILALTRADLFEDHVHIATSWARKYGVKSTKTNRIDDLPLPSFVYHAIDSWCTWEGYIFSYNRGARPAESSRVNDAFKAALVHIGIPEEERATRNLTFHSWRHWLNTALRARGISDAKVREITRHTSEEMTEHYSAFRLEDFKDVAAAQEKLVATFSESSKSGT